jgi:hypothetical protein
MKWLLASLTAMVLALTPGLAFTQDGPDDEVPVRVSADLRLAAGERAGGRGIESSTGSDTAVPSVRQTAS